MWLTHPNLRLMYVSQNFQPLFITPSLIEPIFTASSLEELEIFGAKSFNQECLNSIAVNCKQLTKIDVQVKYHSKVMDPILATIPTIRQLTVQIPNKEIPTESLKYWNNLLSLTLNFVNFRYNLNDLTFALSDFKSQILEVFNVEFSEFPTTAHTKCDVEMFELCIGQMKNMRAIEFSHCMGLQLTDNLLKGLYKSQKFTTLKIIGCQLSESFMNAMTESLHHLAKRFQKF